MASLRNIVAATALLAATVAAQNPYYGGYALVNQNCPSTTQTCSAGVCCPKGTYCFSSDSSNYCCPDNTNCGDTLSEVRTCADPSWSLWDTFVVGDDATDYYCCHQGETGTDGKQACVGKGISVPATEQASTLTNANTASFSGPTKNPNPTGSGSASAYSTGTATSTSKSTSTKSSIFNFKSTAGNGQRDLVQGSLTWIGATLLGALLLGAAAL